MTSMSASTFAATLPPSASPAVVCVGEMKEERVIGAKWAAWAA